MADESIRWARSVIGCDDCDDTNALAGWIVEHDGNVYACLCSRCAATWAPGWRMKGAPPHPPSHEQLSAA